jgi:sugar diacid utilization regulator/putative methionine-R-sulfoxide reductase with GAF domain
MLNTFMTGAGPMVGDLSAALEPIATAASRGQYELLLAEAERAVARLLPSAQARVMLRTAGAWHEWSALEHGLETRAVDLPAGLEALEVAGRVGGGVFLPVVPGALALWIEGDTSCIERSEPLALLCRFFALALQTCERQRIAAQNLDEVQSLQRVATRILKSHDLNEILLLITQEAKRLLSADICGVLLREDDKIVMRRCVGNRSPETANLQMGPGQGLAGLVLAHREPASVEDYVASDAISRDFFRLAEAELVRSALAAPLLGRDDIIGVLEVWRRRPSTFTSQDTTRLVALANLTSIAIENAELYAAQRRMVDELGQAHAALNQRYDVVRSVSSLTQTLMQLLLQRAGLGALVTTVASALSTDVGVVDKDGAMLAWSGEPGRSPAPTADAMPLLGPDAAKAAINGEGQSIVMGSVNFWAQPVFVEGEAVAWILGRLDDGPRIELMALTLTQVAVIAALQRLEQRSASRARSESIDAAVWDLLRADDSTRAAAIDRATDLKLNLDGPLRLYLCEIVTAVPGSAEASGPMQRQKVTQTIAAVLGDNVRAVALQGTSIAVLSDDQALDDSERLAQRLASRLSDALNGRRVVVGGSSRCHVARALTTAYREAQIALDVARQLDRSGAVIYDRAGVVGMLLSLRHEVGMRRFLELNLGDLLKEETKQRDMLLQTLRVFFDVNCSHEAASQNLGVHRKTIAHRLARISDLTGLDFSTHDDRLIADLSLYVYRMLNHRVEGVG